MTKFKTLFEPIRIGNVTIKNRIAMAPMGVEYMVEQDGSYNRRVAEYYLERVRGGAGLIISGCLKVENRIEQLEACTPNITETGLGYLGELCEAAHSFGARFFVQLSAGYGRVTPPSTLAATPVSASPVSNYWDHDLQCRALTTGEVQGLVSAMGENAAKLVAVGVDGFELHGHEGYLFDQFTTSLWNKRTDQYGGGLENRLRFPVECLQAIREMAGNDVPVQYRFGLKHYMKGVDQGAVPGETYEEVGRDSEEGIEMARHLVAAGFDALHVDAGSYESWYWAHPPNYQAHGCLVTMPTQVKEAVDVPVIAVGRLDLPEMAEKVLVDGQADMIALGRALLADPQWPQKTRSGRVADIRPCIACYDGCFQNYYRVRAICCTVNPASGRESSYGLIPALERKTVAIVGGGIAGMEAARVAALRGHTVILYERENVLGGMVVNAAIPDFKADLNRLLDWYRGQLQRVGVQIIMGTFATQDVIAGHHPDAVVFAAGAHPIEPDIPGIDDEKVASSLDLLQGKCKAGERTIIIGGGLVGCEIAIWLAQQGKRSTLVEMLPELMRGGA